MQFGLQVFHRSATSLQGHLAGEDGGPVFALFHLHAPPMTEPYGTLHVVDPSGMPEEGLERLLGGLHVMLNEKLGVAPGSIFVTEAEHEARGEAKDARLAVSRHRPTPDSSRDLVLETVEEGQRLVAVLERFREGKDTMNVLAILDARFRREEEVDRLMHLVDGAIGAPPPGGRHDLDVIFQRFVGELAPDREGPAEPES